MFNFFSFGDTVLQIQLLVRLFTLHFNHPDEYYSCDLDFLSSGRALLSVSQSKDSPMFGEPKIHSSGKWYFG